MALFDQILGAINNPSQQGNSDQLGGILNTVQQLAQNQGVDPGTASVAMSVVGSYVRSSLQEQRVAGGNDRVESLVNQYAGTNPSSGALQALFGPAQQAQLSQAIAQKTGLSAQTIQTILPILVPIALNFLKSGASNSSAGNNASATNPGGNSGGSNSVLSMFLDADGDGDVDLGDTMSMAGRYLSQR